MMTRVIMLCKMVWSYYIIKSIEIPPELLVSLTYRHRLIERNASLGCILSFQWSHSLDLRSKNNLQSFAHWMCVWVCAPTCLTSNESFEFFFFQSFIWYKWKHLNFDFTFIQHFGFAGFFLQISVHFRTASDKRKRNGKKKRIKCAKKYWSNCNSFFINS